MLKNISKLFLLGILLCVAVYIGVFIGRTSAGNVINLSELEKSSAQEYSADQKFNKIDLNSATADDLNDIPGIGPATAKAIISYREEYGRFYKIDELKDVEGISDTLYESIKSYVTVKDSH